MSETKETTLKIEKSPEETVSAVDQKKVKKTQKAFEAFQKELETKVYLIPGGNETANAILRFLENKAEWAAHESLGIVRAHEDVSKSVSSKKKDLFLEGLCVEAVAYYISKASGVGLKEATDFKDFLFMPINEAMAKINEDKKKSESLQYEWAAAAQGVEVEDLKTNK